MSADFSTIHNHHEQAVFAAVLAGREVYPAVAAQDELLADVACVALNRIAPRYIRHRADHAFYQTPRQTGADRAAVADAVKYAFEFVQARVAMRARG